MIRVFRRIFNANWTSPIVEQWPLMVAYIALIGWQSIARNPIPRWMLIFLHAYLAASIVCWFRWCGIKWIVYAIIYVLFLTEQILSMLYGMHLSPTIFILLAETNSREASEFFQTLPAKPNFGALVRMVCLLISANVFLEICQHRVNIWISNKHSVLVAFKGVAALLLIGGVLFSFQYVKLFCSQEMNDIDEWQSHKRNPDDIVTKLILAALDIHLSGKEMVKANEQVKQMIVHPQKSKDTINVILVIGESYIKEHSPLYGYQLMTTPFLCAEQQAGRLFVFTDVISPYNQTTKVIRNIISCNSVGSGEHWSSAPPLTAIFKKSGYEVTMVDNQKVTEGQLLPNLFDFSLNTYLYNTDMIKACYDKINENTYEYDAQIVEHYAQELHKYSSRSIPRLVLFHLMGQHETYKSRYPHNDTYNHFTADSISFRHEDWLTLDMRKQIADYDNATYYNDAVIRMIIQLFRDKQTVLIYLSDHGEEVYDYRPRAGRDDFQLGADIRQSLRYQYCVPFMVWCSDAYRAAHPGIINKLSHAVMRPLMIDNTCHLLFHFANLNPPYYKASRDILSSQYQCPPRIVNDKIDYDEVMSQ